MPNTREKLIELLNKYFTIGDSYAYNLTRVKEAFAVGTMSLDDFVEFDEEVTADIADHLIANGVTVQKKKGECYGEYVIVDEATIPKAKKLLLESMINMIRELAKRDDFWIVKPRSVFGEFSVAWKAYFPEIKLTQDDHKLCPNCGRYRLEQYENGKDRCEKCE